MIFTVNTRQALLYLGGKLKYPLSNLWSTPLLIEGQGKGALPQIKEYWILMRLEFGCGFLGFIIGLLHLCLSYRGSSFVRKKGRMTIHYAFRWTLKPHVDEVDIQSSPHRWTVIQQSPAPRSRGLKLWIMNSEKKEEREEARLGVLPIRAREAHCTAAFIFLVKARRFTLPLISDTDHN